MSSEERELLKLAKICVEASNQIATLSEQLETPFANAMAVCLAAMLATHAKTIREGMLSLGATGQ